MDALQSFLTEHDLYDEAITWGTRIAAALLVLFVGRFVAKVLSGRAERALTKRVDASLGNFVGSIVYASLFVVIVVATLAQLGVDTTSLLTVLGAAGLAIGLALRGSLANFAAGVTLMVLRPFRTGDLVEVGGHMATVESLHVFYTSLVTLNGETLWIPNGQVTDEAITNYSSRPTRRVDIAVDVSYRDDLDEVRRTVHGLIDADERILSEPEPQVLVVGLGDNGVQLRVRPWVETSQWWPVTCELTEQLKRAFDRAGVTIPYPQRDVHMIQQSPKAA